MADSAPIISQLKSAVQLVCGDVDGAAETQKNFVTQCPVLAHVVGGVSATVGWITDDDEVKEFAIKAFKGGNQTIGNVMDGTPGVGHVKGIIHLACGDVNAGSKAFDAANRTTVVASAGVGGFLVGGPVGAGVSGVYAGLTVDGILSFSKDKPIGVFSLPKDHSPGAVVDVVCRVASDGLTGIAAGTTVDRLLRSDQIRAIEDIQARRKLVPSSKTGTHKTLKKHCSTKKCVRVELEEIKKKAKRDAHLKAGLVDETIHAVVKNFETNNKYYGTNKVTLPLFEMNPPSTLSGKANVLVQKVEPLPPESISFGRRSFKYHEIRKVPTDPLISGFDISDTPLDKLIRDLDLERHLLEHLVPSRAEYNAHIGTGVAGTVGLHNSSTENDDC